MCYISRKILKMHICVYRTDHHHHNECLFRFKMFKNVYFSSETITHYIKKKCENTQTFNE